MATFNLNNQIINLKAVLTTLVATVITVGASVWVTKLTGPVPLSINQTLTENKSTFDVTGSTEVSAIPDQAQVRLGVEVNQATIIDAQQEANTTIASIIDALKKIKIDQADIQTQNYSVYPDYDYQSPTRRITGYRVSTQLLVKINDLSLVSSAIDTATQLGANQVGGVSFSLSEDKQQELLTEARRTAIAKAKDDAKDLSKLAGIKLGDIIDIQESQFGNQIQPYYERGVMLDAAGEDEAPVEPTPIEPGSTTFQYQVTLSYETL